MKEYMEKLYHKLHEAMEKPVTLGSAEEVMVYADTICALHKLGDDHFRESTKMMEFTEDDAKAWTARMKNADGSTGAHWTLDQTTELMQRRGINCNPVKFWVAMNAVYSDLSEVAERHGVGNDEFYADMAKSFWLCDKDAVEDKLAAYYENVVKHN